AIGPQRRSEEVAVEPPGAGEPVLAGELAPALLRAEVEGADSVLDVRVGKRWDGQFVRELGFRHRGGRDPACGQTGRDEQRDGRDRRGSAQSHRSSRRPSSAWMPAAAKPARAPTPAPIARLGMNAMSMAGPAPIAPVPASSPPRARLMNPYAAPQMVRVSTGRATRAKPTVPIHTAPVIPMRTNARSGPSPRTGHSPVSGHSRAREDRPTMSGQDRGSRVRGSSFIPSTL